MLVANCLDVGAWKTEGVQELPFAGAPFENVLSAISQNSVALSLLVRPELRRVFTNLATLDQVLKVATVQATTPSKGWIGETEIIDWIWVRIGVAQMLLNIREPASSNCLVMRTRPSVLSSQW